MCFDTGVPAGFTDADIEQREFEDAANADAALHAQGICTHGWTQGVPARGWPTWQSIALDRLRGAFPERATEYDRPPEGMVLCLDCGEYVEDPLAGEL